MIFTIPFNVYAKLAKTKPTETIGNTYTMEVPPKTLLYPAIYQNRRYSIKFNTKGNKIVISMYNADYETCQNYNWPIVYALKMAVGQKDPEFTDKTLFTCDKNNKELLNVYRIIIDFFALYGTVKETETA